MAYSLLAALWFHNVISKDFGIAVNVFWKHLQNDLYDGKDTYGNKDLIPAQRAMQIVEFTLIMLSKPWKIFLKNTGTSTLGGLCWEYSLKLSKKIAETKIANENKQHKFLMLYSLDLCCLFGTNEVCCTKSLGMILCNAVWILGKCHFSFDVKNMNANVYAYKMRAKYKKHIFIKKNIYLRILSSSKNLASSK